jgi:hypothetical protein
MPRDPVAGDRRGRHERPKASSMFRVIASVVVPVIIAMGLCVWLVLLLHNEAYDDLEQSGGITSAVYTEKVRRRRIENQSRLFGLTAFLDAVARVDATHASIAFEKCRVLTRARARISTHSSDR